MLDLDAIQARADAATHADWVQGAHWVYRYPGIGDPPGLISIAGKVEHQADVEFIAHARMDVPALVAELRAARQVIEIARHADAPGLRAAIHAYDYAMRDED